MSERSERTTRSATVIGPVTGANPPWGAPSVDLVERGYVCEEYLLDGTTVAYVMADGSKPGDDGRWEIEELGEAPYHTRILVLRPTDPAAFSGTVVLNWQNVSGGAEASTHRGDEVYRGHAWVGASVQEIGIDGMPAGSSRGGFPAGVGLVDRDPERYGTLFHPGDQGAYEIFTQAARAVGPGRVRDGDVDPVGGLDVRHVVATGGSQSAMRLAAYANSVQRHDRAIHGFLLAIWEGRAPRIEEGSMSGGVRTMIRTDLGTPTLVVNSEFEAHALLALPQIADTDAFRLWEVTGTPHAPARGTHPDENGMVANDLSYGQVHEMALRLMHRWLEDGTPAPSQPRIAVDEGPPRTIRRDELGNAVGGIRLPEVAAPTKAYRGMAFSTGRPPLFGAARPFTDAELRSLYRDRADHAARWAAAVDHLVATEAIRPEDAAAMKARAAEVRLPFD